MENDTTPAAPQPETPPQEGGAPAPRALPVKRYPFRFSTLTLLLILLGLLLSAAGFALTTWQFTGFLSDGDMTSVYEWLKYALLYLVSVLFAVLLTAMLIRSQYILNDRELVMQFGLIRSRYALKTIYSVHLFKGANKLAVYFDDFHTKYMVIVVKESWYDDFVKSLLERNEKIGFSFSTAEEENDAKKK